MRARRGAWRPLCGGARRFAGATLVAIGIPALAGAEPVAWQDVFDDGFESGLAAWNVANAPEGDLLASEAAALDGTLGLEAVVDDTDGLFVQDNSPTDEHHYRASFRFDTNAFDPGEAQGHLRTRIFIGFEDGPRRLFAVVLRRRAGAYALLGRTRLDDNGQANTPFVPIADGAHTVHVYWKRSSSPDASDGMFEMTVDGVPFTLAGLDNSRSTVDFVRLGALSVKGGAAGSLYWDDFTSFRNFAARALACDAPADGALVDVVPGTAVSVGGTALGLTGVTVNGIPVPLAADRTFTASVTGRHGLNFVELSGTYGSGTQTALCTFLGSQRWIDEGRRNFDALAFRVEPSGLTKLNALVPSWFAGPRPAQALHAAMLTANPLFDFGGGALRLTYRTLSMTVGQVEVSRPSQNQLQVRVQMSVRFQVRAQGSFPFSFTDDGEVVLTNMSADLRVGFHIDPMTSRISARGDQVANWHTGAMSTAGFGLAPDLMNVMQDYLAEEFPDVVAERLGPILLGGAAGLYAGMFQGMATTAVESSFPVGRLDGSGTVSVALGMRAEDAPPGSACVALRDDGLDICTALAVTAPVFTGAPMRVPMPPPENAFTPSSAAEARAVVHVGLVSQVLQALWRSALFDGNVDGATVDPALPTGTSFDVLLRTMPILTRFPTADTAELDIGTLDLVVTHPDLPADLRVTAQARVNAHMALAGDDVAYDEFVVTEQNVSTADVALDLGTRATLEDLVGRLVKKVADVALNDSLPALPQQVFTLPASAADYGLTPGTQLRVHQPAFSPSTLPVPSNVFLFGGFFPPP